jgi:hypothetical protein
MRNDFQMREQLAKGGMPARNKKNFRPTKSGAGMTEAGVKAYRRTSLKQPKIQTHVFVRQEGDGNVKEKESN